LKELGLIDQKTAMAATKAKTVKGEEGDIWSWDKTRRGGLWLLAETADLLILPAVPQQSFGLVSVTLLRVRIDIFSTAKLDGG
jgi:hypothetical protein